MMHPFGYKNILPFASRENHYRLRAVAIHQFGTSNISSQYGEAIRALSYEHIRCSRNSAILCLSGSSIHQRDIPVCRKYRTPVLCSQKLSFLHST
jgi:hypothetical protein